MLLLLAAVLRYESHPEQSTCVECTIQWLLGYSQSLQPSPQSILEHFGYPKIHLLAVPPPPKKIPTPGPNPRQLCSLLQWICLFWTSCVCAKSCHLLWPTSSTSWHDVLMVRSCCRMYQHPVPFYCWEIFHCMDMPRLLKRNNLLKLSRREKYKRERTASHYKATFYMVYSESHI